MKRKIALYTIQSMNYGNRLQNYALYRTLIKMNFEVQTLKTSSDKDNRILFEQKHVKLKKLSFLHKYFSNVKKIIRFLLIKDLIHNFSCFNKLIKYSKDYISIRDYTDNIEKKYDYFIVGSDQVWNTDFQDLVSINSFLPFKHNNKIAYAASFGKETAQLNTQMIDALREFKYISVRENAGAKIVKDLIGRDVPVVIDPTLLITKDEWKKIEKKTCNVQDGYILTYFLSPMCTEAANKLKEISNGKEVVQLLNRSDEVGGKAGPSEFLWLINHADIILTDSFHACVFSFLFDKPFVVYNRNWNECNMNSRLLTLLSMFHLERKYNNSGLENDIWEHDYTDGYKQLEIEREKALNFLQNALDY